MDNNYGHKYMWLQFLGFKSLNPNLWLPFDHSHVDTDINLSFMQHYCIQLLWHFVVSPGKTKAVSSAEWRWSAGPSCSSRSGYLSGDIMIIFCSPTVTFSSELRFQFWLNSQDLYSAFRETWLLLELRRVLSCELRAVFLHFPLEEKGPWGPFHQLRQVLAKGRNLLQILLRALHLAQVINLEVSTRCRLYQAY